VEGTDAGEASQGKWLAALIFNLLSGW